MYICRTWTRTAVNAWIITGHTPDGSRLKPLKVPAESFDEAIEEARKINRFYNGGKVNEEKEL